MANQKDPKATELMNSIASKLKLLMQDLGIRYSSEFAEIMGISSARLSNILKPRVCPDATFFQRLKDHYPNVTIDDFYDLSKKRVRINKDEPKAKLTAPQQDSYKDKYFDMLEKYNAELEKRLG